MDEQRRYTHSLTGGQWVTVILLSLVTPLVVGADKAIQLSRARRSAPVPDRSGTMAPTPAAT